MIYLLIFTILLFFIFSFFIFGKNILNPSVVLNGTFLVSLLFSAFNIKKWGVSFSEETYLIVVLALLFFLVGNLLVKTLNIKIQKNSEYKVLKISFLKFLVINVILLIGLYKYFKDTYYLSLMAGNPGNLKLMLYYVREAKLKFYDVSKISNLFFMLAQAFAYVSIFYFFFIVINNKFKIKKILILLPAVIYLGFLFLTGGRTGFIYLIVYSINIAFLLSYHKNNYTVRNLKKIVFYLVLSLIIFFIVFSIAGSLKGQLQTKEAIAERIAIYTGSSIPALNEYINSGKIITNNIIGGNLFFNLYSFLKKLGMEIPNLYAPLYFTDFEAGYRTNVYSGIIRYINDLGLFGMLLIMLFLGFFYGTFYSFISKRKNAFLLILYSMYCYPVYEFVIEERFFMDLFPYGFLYMFAFISFAYLILIKDNRIFYNKKK